VTFDTTAHALPVQGDSRKQRELQRRDLGESSSAVPGGPRSCRASLTIAGPLNDLNVIANELRSLGEQVRSLQARMTEVEKVNGQLENAALTTSRALEEIARHWDAVYEAMRRAEAVEEAEQSAKSQPVPPQ
jgi:hypothetical protein